MNAGRPVCNLKNLGDEQILDVLVTAQLDDCYDPVYFPKRWRQGYTKQ